MSAPSRRSRADARDTISASDWLDTPSLCNALGISRSTLGRWRRRGLLIASHHWVR